MISKILRFAQQDVWRMRLDELQGKRFYFVKAARIAILSFREFTNDICSLRASALTFYTLLSIIPVFAMAFGIAKGFGLQNLIERQIMTQLKGQEEVAKWIINFAYSFLENTQGEKIKYLYIAIIELNNVTAEHHCTSCKYEALKQIYRIPQLEKVHRLS